MYKRQKISETSIRRNEGYEGETMETKVERIMNNKEEPNDGAPLIYTERNEGVLAGYNIRTDRFEVAIEATDKITGSQISKREENQKKRIEEYNKKHGKTPDGDGQAESTQGTSGQQEGAEK